MVLPGGGLSTDVGMIISSAFPNGKPEMAASDFKRAYDITKATLAGKPRPAKTSLDYATWAHCLMVEWKLSCDQAKKDGVKEPNHLTCPECGVSLLLDHTQSDVLTCPGGCNRAIMVGSFTALFRNVKPKANPNWYNQTSTGHTLYPSTSGRAPAGKASIAGSIQPGQDPVALGIVEKMSKSRKPLSSWRTWKVVDDGEPLRLKSISYGEYWPAMEPIKAKCVGGNDGDHECPSWHHRCGVYSVKELEHVSRWATSRHPGSTQITVIGEIEMWGRVLEYTDGYRSEYAYPLKLYVPSDFGGYTYDGWDSPEDFAEKLWSRYLVEVEQNDNIVIDLRED